jgi:hypothetical protein
MFLVFVFLISMSIIPFVLIHGYAAIAQLARASPCQGEGRGFESRSPLQSFTSLLLSLPDGEMVSQRPLKPYF